MITYKNILVSLISQIRGTIKEVTVTSNDISEGFERPSFFIDIENVRPENFMNKFSEKTLDIEILYFPKDINKNQLELLEITDILSKNFIDNNYIELEDGLIVEVKNAKFNTVNKVLHFDFEIFISEEYEEKEYELMEEIELGGDYGN